MTRGQRDHLVRAYRWGFITHLELREKLNLTAAQVRRRYGVQQPTASASPSAVPWRVLAAPPRRTETMPSINRTVVVTTRYAGPTNTKPSRVAVSIGARARRIYVSWDHAMDPAQMHAHAAEEAVRRHVGDAASNVRMTNRLTLPDNNPDMYVITVALVESLD